MRCRECLGSGLVSYSSETAIDRSTGTKTVTEENALQAIVDAIEDLGDKIERKLEWLVK